MSVTLEHKIIKSKQAKKLLVTVAVSTPIIFWLISWLG